MLVTLIRDAYKQGEEQGLATALDELCSPTDNLGWASAGVYLFWDFATRKILYVGLAVDLAQRFRQHNGLLQCEPNGCKKEKIEAYFRTQQTLGYSIFVQSPLDQPITAKVAKMFMEIDIDDKQNYPSEAGRGNISELEGNLIEVQRLRDAALPPWNKIAGSTLGRDNAKPSHVKVIDLAAKGDDMMVSRKTIRELADDRRAQWYEENLHAARLHGLGDDDLLPAIRQLQDMNPDGAKLFDEILQSGYLEQPCPYSDQ